MAGVLTPCFSAALPRDLGAWRRRSASLAASPPTELGAGCGPQRRHSSTTTHPRTTTGDTAAAGDWYNFGTRCLQVISIQTFNTAVMYAMQCNAPLLTTSSQIHKVIRYLDNRHGPAEVPLCTAVVVGWAGLGWADPPGARNSNCRM